MWTVQRKQQQSMRTVLFPRKSMRSELFLCNSMSGLFQNCKNVKVSATITHFLLMISKKIKKKKLVNSCRYWSRTEVCTCILFL